jgi:hypothetical protein
MSWELSEKRFLAEKTTGKSKLQDEMFWKDDDDEV